MAQRSGRAGQLSIAGTFVNIKKWTFKWDKGLQDSTDSGNYDATDQETYGAQLPTVIRGEGSLEFFWDSATTPTSLISKFKADPTVLIELWYDRSNKAFSMQADFSDVEIDLEIAGIIQGTANFKNNGKITSF
jgi:hypothetical protein